MLLILYVLNALLASASAVLVCSYIMTLTNDPCSRANYLMSVVFSLLVLNCVFTNLFFFGFGVAFLITIHNFNLKNFIWYRT